MTTKTQEYLFQVRKKTKLSDYKISKKYDINQSNLSKYSSGKAALSEMHSWLFADILEINPAIVVANTKLEHANLTNNKIKAIFWQEQLQKLLDNSKPIKIQIAQINAIVGDIKANANKIINLSIKAKQEGIHLLIFPELFLTGYIPEDLLLRDDFIKQVNKAVITIQQQVPSSISVVFGAIKKEKNYLYNAAYLLQNSRLRTYYKQKLPNYGIFDEKRYFSVGEKPLVFECQDTKFGIVICEDAWEQDPINACLDLGAEKIISINASPFQIKKHQQRIELIKNNVLKNNIDFIYVNTVGAQDEFVFDGGSFVINKKAEITHQLPFFQEIIHNLDRLYIEQAPNDEKMVYDAIVLSVKNYVEKNNIFTGAVLGLSGGIDSALTLAIASDALGCENTMAVMMPYQYTSNISLEDAKTQANLMNVEYQKIEIHSIVNEFNQQLSSVFTNNIYDVTEENIQARTRATLLMAIANKFNKILLTTGNKSEIAVGYTTLYGDMAGGFAPLKDVPKTWVYRLAKYRNTISKIIPNRVIEREPSAELAPNQIDKDSLPAYDELDEILELFIEQKYSVEDIINNGFNKDVVSKICQQVLNNEHKRRQGPIGPKITSNAFGKERRYPITSKFKP